MDLNSVNIRPCKYRVKSCIFKIGGRADFVLNPDYISEIYIEKDFDEMVFPYFELTVTLPPSTYRDMQTNNKEIRCFFELQVAYSSSLGNSEAAEDLVYDTILQNTFFVFLGDHSPDATSSITKTYEDSAYLQKDQYSAGDAATIRLILYNEEYLFRGRTLVNTALKDATLADGIIYIINKSKLKDVLFAIPDNDTKYEQLIIPPLSAYENLSRLISLYSVYEYGGRVFFDLDRGYIIDNYVCTVWEPNEIGKVYIISKQATDSGSTFRTGSYEDRGRKFYAVNVEASGINVNTGSVLVDQTSGTNFITVHTATGDITKAESGADTTSTGGTSQVLVDNSGEKKDSSIGFRVRQASKVITINLSNFNFDHLKPNREYILSFDTAEFVEYGGSYVISSLTIDLQKDGDCFLSSGSAKFKGYDEDPR